MGIHLITNSNYRYNLLTMHKYIVIILISFFSVNFAFCGNLAYQILSSKVQAIAVVEDVKIINPEVLPFSAMKRIAVSYSDVMFTKLVSFKLEQYLTATPLRTEFSALCLEIRNPFIEPPAGTIAFHIKKGDRVYVAIDKKTSWISAYTVLYPALEKALVNDKKNVLIEKGRAFVKNNGTLLIEKAIREFSKGKYAHAVADYHEGFITLNKSYGPNFEHIGFKHMDLWAEAFYKTGDWEDAVGIFQKYYLRYSKEKTFNRIMDCVNHLKDTKLLKKLFEEQLKYARLKNTATRKGEEQIGRNIKINIDDCYREIKVFKNMIKYYKKYHLKKELNRASFLLERIKKQKNQEIKWLKFKENCELNLKNKNYKQALKDARNAIIIGSKRFGRVNKKVSIMQNLMAQIYLKDNNLKKAEVLYKAAWDNIKHQLLGPSVERGLLLNTAGLIEMHKKNYKTALKKLVESLLNLKINLPYHNKLVINTMKNLSEVYGKTNQYELKRALDFKILQAKKVSKIYH